MMKITIEFIENCRNVLCQTFIKNKIFLKKILFFIFFIVSVLIFAGSASIAGITWDEFIHRAGALQQFQVAFEFLNGEETSFRKLPSDWAFYGVIPVGIVTAIDGLFKAVTGENLNARAFGIWLHGITFILYFLSIFLVYDLLRRYSQHWLTAYLGAFFLLLYPLWFGYGLMNYKDLPTAFFLLMLVYFSTRAISSENKNFINYTILCILATIALGGTKVAAVAISFVPWLAITYAAFRRRLLWLPFLSAIGVVVGLIIITPVSWPDPIVFFIASVELMSRHPWAGCIITNGVCIGPSQSDWSAANYLWDWARVQLPTIILVGILPAILYALWLGGVGRMVAGTLIFALGGIVLSNASLYDGLRHVLFAIPLIIIVFFMAIDYVIVSCGRIVRLGILTLICIEMALFGVDNFRLFPYNYVYFNLATRYNIDISRYETDFWGFSLHEAVTRSFPYEKPNGPIVGNPHHIVGASLPEGVWSMNKDDSRSTNYKGPYIYISYSRGGSIPPENCNTVYEVFRSLIGGPPLLLSYVSHCEIK